MRHRAVTRAVLASLLLASGAARAAEPPIEIPVMQPLSGSAAFVGQTGAQALRIEEKLINAQGGIHGRPVHLAVSDDQTSAAIAAHAPVILGSSITAMCGAVAPLVAANGPVLYCYSPGIHPAPGSFAFSAGASSEALMGALVRYYHLRGWNRIAFLSSSDASGKDGEKGFDDTVASPEFAGKITVTTKQNFNPTDVSVISQIERIRESKPDALVAWSTGVMFGTVLKALAQSGTDLPVGSSAGNLSYPLMGQFAGVLPKQLFFSGNEGSPRGEGMGLDPRVDAAKRAYYAAFAAEKLVPDNGAEVVWDATMLAVEGLRHAPEGSGAVGLRDWLAGLTDYAGVSGVYDFHKFPQRGLGPDAPVVSQWDQTEGMFRAMSRPGGTPITH